MCSFAQFSFFFENVYLKEGILVMNKHHIKSLQNTHIIKALLPIKSLLINRSPYKYLFPYTTEIQGNSNVILYSLYTCSFYFLHPLHSSEMSATFGAHSREKK